MTEKPEAPAQAAPAVADDTPQEAVERPAEATVDPPAAAPEPAAASWYTAGAAASDVAPESSSWAEPEAPAAPAPPVPPAWNPDQSSAFGSAHVSEAELADPEAGAPAPDETAPETEQPVETSSQMGLTYDQAQHEMLKGMTPEQRIAHFQQESPAQQAAVDSWHRQQFGVPTQSSPKF